VISELAPDTAAKLAAFSAHDPTLLQALSSAYRDANALLASRGRAARVPAQLRRAAAGARRARGLPRRP